MKTKKSTLARLMIEKQKLNQDISNPGKHEIYSIIESLGCLQIDTISVLERAHYLTLWSRLGNYKKEYLDTLAFKDRRLFEYWAHAACYVPMEHYKYYMFAMDERKKDVIPRLKKRTGKGQELIDHVMERIKNEGPLASKDFQSEKKRKGGWWNRKDEKIAMDYLYSAGILAISERKNFQRYYDLSENVIPDRINKEEPTQEERTRFFIEKTMRCLGGIIPKDTREYYQHGLIKIDMTTAQIGEWLDKQENMDSLQIEDKSTYYYLKEDQVRLDEIDDDFNFEDVQMVIYFDNFMWNRDRIKRLFNFESKLEIYLPIEQRIYGYYHLPILYGDKIVARIEPKIERNEERLIIKGYWTEPEFKETEHYRDRLEKNLEDFAVFHGAKTIEWLC
ncbi:MAG: YcaQ family DNA glycosylase [Candidatus Thorarchaeota archaeon]|nr:YcaQ family DNA glycosylase [Candidatus Thorarchaeota archaeon]